MHLTPLLGQPLKHASGKNIHACKMQTCITSITSIRVGQHPVEILGSDNDIPKILMKSR